MSDEKNDAVPENGKVVVTSYEIDEVLEHLLYQLKEWASTIYQNATKIDRAIKVDKEKRWIHLVIFTHTNKYSIGVHAKDTIKNSYLGCTARTRKPRVGETWTRGNDLPDGKFNIETWNDILRGIVRYEAQEIKSEKWKE